MAIKEKSALPLRLRVIHALALRGLHFGGVKEAVSLRNPSEVTNTELTPILQEVASWPTRVEL